MRRRTIKIEIVFFDVLAMIAFAIGQAEEPLLENRIFAIPEREGEAEQLLVIRNSWQDHLHPSDKRAIGPDRG